ncbi:MAG: hypothetical protein N2053_07370 [Chitinispirillaceae bacterium]|nr:hypothetical protein [Chitinispirillaceae bacterium]
MLRKKYVIFCWIIILITISYSEEKEEIAPRVSYNIPLLKLSVIDSSGSIRISKQGTDDYVIIANQSDVLVKNTSSDVSKITYFEPSDKSYYISDFEAKQLLAVTNSLVETLEGFEENLKKEKWSHCLYLDSFLPKFLRCFYVLIGTTRNSGEKYLQKTLFLEKEYDISLNSPKSDKRINSWREVPEGVVKLRIATKELIYQLNLWKKRELMNKERNPEMFLGAKVEETLDLFISIYFFIKKPVACK